MQSEEREQAIINVLAQRKGFLPFHDIERSVQSSSATLRRDLQRMAREGRIKRIRGAAKLTHDDQLDSSLPQRLLGVPFRDNIARHRRQKQAIGRAAAALCTPGTSVCIGAGSTTLQMCRYLQGLNLRILTNSLHVVTALALQEGTRVTVSGGTLFREQNIVLQPHLPDGLRQKTSQFFMSAAALGTKGVMQADRFVAAAERHLIEQCDQLILLVDSSKFKGRGVVVCELDELDVVVTDPGIAGRDLVMLRDRAVNVVIAT